MSESDRVDTVDAIDTVDDVGNAEPLDFACCYCEGGIVTIPSFALTTDRVQCVQCGSPYAVGLLLFSGKVAVW